MRRIVPLLLGFLLPLSVLAAQVPHALPPASIYQIRHRQPLSVSVIHAAQAELPYAVYDKDQGKTIAAFATYQAAQAYLAYLTDMSAYRYHPTTH